MELGLRVWGEGRAGTWLVVMIIIAGNVLSTLRCELI